MLWHDIDPAACICEKVRADYPAFWVLTALFFLVFTNYYGILGPISERHVYFECHSCQTWSVLNLYSGVDFPPLRVTLLAEYVWQIISIWTMKPIYLTQNWVQNLNQFGPSWIVKLHESKACLLKSSSAGSKSWDWIKLRGSEGNNGILYWTEIESRNWFAQSLTFQSCSVNNCFPLRQTNLVELYSSGEDFHLQTDLILSLSFYILARVCRAVTLPTSIFKKPLWINEDLMLFNIDGKVLLIRVTQKISPIKIS